MQSKDNFLEFSLNLQLEPEMNDKNNDDLFLKVAQELANKRIDEALWTKAYALENGDDRKTKAHYIRLRVNQLEQKFSTHTDSMHHNIEQSDDPQIKISSTKTDRSQKSSGSNVLLWPRFWARSIDFLICIVLMQPFSLATSLAIKNPLISVALSFFIAGAFLVLYDAILTTLFGATIGKWVAGIEVKLIDGSSLPFSASVKRAFFVFASGNGMYLFYPVGPAFAWWNSRKIALSTGATKWDSKYNTVVFQRSKNDLRNILVTIVGFVCLCGTVLVIQVIKQTNKILINQETKASRDIEKSQPNSDLYASPQQTAPIQTAQPANVFQSLPSEPSVPSLDTWHLISEVAGSSVYVKPDTIRTIGVISSIIFIENLGGSSSKGKMEMNCSQRTARISYTELYSSPMATGNMFDSFDNPSRDFKPIGPGANNLFQSIINFVCR